MLYFHCYAHINITTVQFSLLIRIIFTLLLYIFVATSYFHCNPIFLLHAHICIANSYLYCKRIFLLQVHSFMQAHIFIVSAYFCCNLVEIFPTLCKKFLTLFKKFLTVWRYAKPGKQNKGNRENETTINGDLRESQSVGKKRKA